MAGNRFTKKLQAIKSRMMMDDVPVDSSRRKLFTLPPEETSQSLPATKQTSKESPLTQLANKPVDRRGFLKQAGQSAKSAAVRGILPELGKLVEVPIEKALPQPTDFSLIHNKLKDIIIGDIEDNRIHISDWYGLIRPFVDENKISKSMLNKLDKLADDAIDGHRDSARKMYEEGIYDLLDSVDPDQLTNVVHSLPTLEDAHMVDFIETINKDKDVPKDLMKDFLDMNDPRYHDFSEEEIDELFQELNNKKSE